MTLEEIVAGLYGLPPAEFVAARTERVRQARDSGDKGLAAALGKLRRPTVAAWAVNLLAREAGDDVHALLDLGAALREAQRRLSAEQLRTLGTQRQQVVNALTRKAAELAGTHGQRLTESVLRDIGGTLQAALADPGIAEQVRTGTLTTAATYEGFGPAGLTAVPATRGRAEPARTSGKGAHDRAEPPSSQRGARTGSTKKQTDPQAEARRELEVTLADLESARTATASARAEHDSATSALSDLDARITRLRGELTDAEAQRRFAAATERSTRDNLQRTTKHLEAAERRAEQARRHLSAS